MRAALAVAVLAAALGGCTTMNIDTQWTKAGVGTQQETYDDVQCMRKADAVPPTPDLLVGGLVDIGREVIVDARRDGTYTGCMKALGYRKA